MLEGIVFDMDGLMFDSEAVWSASWLPAFSARGLTLKAGVIGDCVGSGRERNLRIVAEAYNGNPAALAAYEDHFAIADRIFKESGASKKPGLDELLGWLGQMSLPTAVASSSSQEIVHALLAHGGLSHRFDVVITGDDGYPSKPDPAIFLAVAQKLELDSSKTAVLEDSPNGIRAAYAGGFIPIMVPDTVQPTHDVRDMCHAVCTTLLDVISNLEQLCR